VAVDGDESANSRPGRFATRERALGVEWIGSWALGVEWIGSRALGAEWIGNWDLGVEWIGSWALGAEWIGSWALGDGMDRKLGGPTADRETMKEISLLPLPSNP
jgi:hypothetical protein